MERMRSQFTEEQIVELGYFVSLTFGQQRWIKTLGIGPSEVGRRDGHRAGGSPSRARAGEGGAMSHDGTAHAGYAIRRRAPHVLEVYEQTRDTVLESGIVERELKELCARYLAEDDEVVAHATDLERSDERQRAALAWADAIAWNSDRADDDLWRRLHSAFTERQLVELGYSIAIALNQQHWLATLAKRERPSGAPRGPAGASGAQRLDPVSYQLHDVTVLAALRGL